MWLSSYNYLLSQRFLWFSLVQDVRLYSLCCVARGEYKVLSKTVTRDVSQLEKTLSEVIQ